MVIKVVQDELVEMLGEKGEGLNLAAVPPVPILLVGLQGSGKPTTTAQIGLRLRTRDLTKVPTASLDLALTAAPEPGTDDRREGLTCVSSCSHGGSADE